ncbi:MAG: ABC transporter ATP-binding protein [Gemmatimonadota bacterium]|nr:ABC transporter ATP-binding protein [Gemmatimonadota bacterium]MDH5760607.1 ABC transporter ATP-binding protein [Gemmatimonadota bacterium]
MSIDFHDVHKSFGSKEILKGFTLSVRDGETLSIIGQSGVGKSVALKHIVGLLRPDRGEIWMDGENVGRQSEETLYALRRQVGYVFQFAALFDSMTIADNVAMGLRRMGEMDEEAIAARVAECLAMVELDGYGRRYPAELSGGQKKRAGVARAIAARPKYILYDEPTTGLDPVTTTIIDELVIRTSEELGVTGVVVTHDMTSAYRISDRIAMLYEGRIRFVGSPEEVRACADPVVKGFIEGRPDLMERVT